MTVSEHIGWLKIYFDGMTAGNWADMRLRCERQLNELNAALSDQAGGWQDIVAERQRQISKEGWTTGHDDEHTERSLASAALCYVYASVFNSNYSDFIQKFWPWDRKWWKPSDQRRNLVKAGALILAEIERLDRVAAPPPSSTAGGDK